ncbi:DUF1192 domain-containing protein [Rhodobacteraceae bacterium RKSG542]|uniref:DUF1192 domain-containing protein n=1 Tax=Pseudovibrio flavus TaxID=2529854 RepID=UPI0012BCEF67|nr:DUF1192 domain-containing protein [Pseudovibrio flavus]MTI16577.1 DUF1192 domain-containing protein [Pseudovibrio flavus]
MPLFDDDEPKRAPLGEIYVGQSLVSMSVDELRDRIAALEAEIKRHKTELDNKSSASSAAESLFK